MATSIPLCSARGASGTCRCWSPILCHGGHSGWRQAVHRLGGSVLPAHQADVGGGSRQLSCAFTF